MRVLHQVELAALPGHAGEAGPASLAQPGVIVAGDQPHAVQAAVDERREERTPVDLGLGERDAHAQDRASAVGRDADRHQHGTIDDAAAVADFFVAGVEDQVGRRAQRPIAPDFQLGIEQLGRPADLHAGDVAAAQFAGDLGHLARGDALHVHLGQGQLQGPFAAFAPFERRRIELDAAGLRHLQVQLAEAAGDGLGLEAVGIAASRFGALVGSGAEHRGAFELHGFVEEGFECLGHAVESVLGQEVDNFVAGVRLIVVGHCGESFRFA